MYVWIQAGKMLRKWDAANKLQTPDFFTGGAGRSHNSSEMRSLFQSEVAPHILSLFSATIKCINVSILQLSKEYN